MQHKRSRTNDYRGLTEYYDDLSGDKKTGIFVSANYWLLFHKYDE
jgi:hypothetical protein